MFSDVKSLLRDWLWKQYAMYRLHHLDDRLLADLGIERNDIPALIKGDRKR